MTTVINKKYKSNVMNLDEYLQTLSTADQRKFLSTLLSASRELPSIRFTQMEKFFKELQRRINDQLPEAWEVQIVGGVEALSTKGGLPFRIFKPGTKLGVVLDFSGNDFSGLRIGIRRISNEIDLSAFVNQDCFLQFKKSKGDEYQKPLKNKYWLYQNIYKGSLWKKILSEGDESVLRKLEADMMQMQKDFKILLSN